MTANDACQCARATARQNGTTHLTVLFGKPSWACKAEIVTAAQAVTRVGICMNFMFVSVVESRPGAAMGLSMQKQSQK